MARHRSLGGLLAALTAASLGACTVDDATLSALSNLKSNKGNTRPVTASGTPSIGGGVESTPATSGASPAASSQPSPSASAASPSPATSPTAATSPSPTPTTGTSASPSPTPTTSTPPTPSPNPTATAKPSPTPSPTPTPTPTPAPTPTPTPAPNAVSITSIAPTAPMPVINSIPSIFVPGTGAGTDVYPTSVRLKATVLMSDASTTSSVTWWSDNPLGALVDSTGLVSAVSESGVYIWATSLDGRASGSFTINVLRGSAAAVTVE